MGEKINPVRGPHNQYHIHLKSDATVSPSGARLTSSGIGHLEYPQTSLKKKVLFVVTQSEFGGAQKFLHTLITHLNKTGYEIMVAAGPAELRIRNYDLLDKFENEGVKTVRLKHLHREISPLSDIRALFELKKLIKEFGPDTLFLLSSKAGFLGSLASKLQTQNYLPNHRSQVRLSEGQTKFKIIYRIGGWSFNDPGPKWKKWLWIFLERLSARWKDIIIVNNKYDLGQANKLNIKPRNEVVLIYNGLAVYKIDFMSQEESKVRLFEQAAKQSGKIFNAEIIIGAIANFYPTKGLRYLIETAEYFKNNDDIVFVVIGDGTERPQLEQLITKKGLRKKILLLGQLPDAYQLMPAFDIFILPSVKEGFPWVIIEAMAAKLPVITTKVGAIPDIIEDGKNGMLVEPAYPEQMVKKVQELINNEHLRQELGIHAHQTVLFKFPLEKMIREVEATIN